MLLMVIRPLTGSKNDATRITHKWGGTLINYALGLGYDVLDISHHNANYETMTKILKEFHPDILVHFGHGCENYLAGDVDCMITNGATQDTTCVQCVKPSNLLNLNDTIMITYSCHSASQFGKSVVAAGAKAYVGFTDFMMFSEDELGVQDIFRDALLPLSEMILRGYTVQEAHDQTVDTLLDLVRQWRLVKFISVPLMWNHNYISLIGDGNAKLDIVPSKSPSPDILYRGGLA